MHIVEKERPWFSCQFVAVEKDGKTYYIPCDGRLGIEPKPRQVWERLIHELTRSLENISEEDMAEYQQYLAMEQELTQESSTAKKRKTTPGYVYVIQGNEYFKIGATTDPERRLRPFTVHAPFPIKVRLLIPSLDIGRTEQDLHRQFSAQRTRGEWFNLTEEDIEMIRQAYPTIDPAMLNAE